MPYTKVIHNSAGQSHPSILITRNMNGTNEERGYRLYWHPIDEAGKPTGDIICPALGLATSNPFRTEGAAIAAGERHGWGKAEFRLLGCGDLQCIGRKH